LPTRIFGVALLLGGLLTLGLNVAFTPLLPLDGAFSEIASSPFYLPRLGSAAIASLLLLFGLVGLYQRHREKVGLFGVCAFVIAFAGSAMVFAHEWAQVFFVHPLAALSPRALDALDDADMGTLYGFEGLAAVLGFTLGWLLLCVSMLLARVVPRLGPALVIAGFLLAAPLSAVIQPVTAMIIGMAVVSSGWMLLGRDLLRAPRG
jgi:hypothetical protein